MLGVLCRWQSFLIPGARKMRCKGFRALLRQTNNHWAGSANVKSAACCDHVESCTPEAGKIATRLVELVRRSVLCASSDYQTHNV